MMKRAVLFVVLVLAMVTGCDQQRQAPKGGQAPMPGGPVMKSPEEIRQLEQLARQSPKSAEAWTMLGNALMDSNRFAEAADAYGKSLDLEPKNVNVRVDRGTCLRNMGKPKEAIEEYRKALKIDPNHVNANRNTGVVLTYDLNDKKGAIKAFEKYLEVAPMAPDAAQIRQLVQELKASK
jgi:cytochrome c-type biogenesis protein CcmH/NrfG